MFSMCLHFSKVDSPSHQFQNAESEHQASPSVTLPQDWEWYQQQQVPGYLAAAELTINIFHIACGIARKASFNYHQE